MRWQPIETAPKDIYLLIFSDSDGCHIAFWHETYGWVDSTAVDQCGDYEVVENPTHWMPLPKNPE